MRRRFAFALLAAFPLLIVAACTTNGLVAQGGACFQSLDCQPGLVCAPATGTVLVDGGTCTNTLPPNVVNVPDAATGDAAQQEAGDAATSDAPVDVFVKDTGTQDTGTQDTGAQDTGILDTGLGG